MALNKFIFRFCSQPDPGGYHSNPVTGLERKVILSILPGRMRNELQQGFVTIFEVMDHFENLIKVMDSLFPQKRTDTHLPRISRDSSMEPLKNFCTMDTGGSPERVKEIRKEHESEMQGNTDPMVLQAFEMLSCFMN